MHVWLFLTMHITGNIFLPLVALMHSNSTNLSGHSFTELGTLFYTKRQFPTYFVFDLFVELFMI